MGRFAWLCELIDDLVDRWPWVRWVVIAVVGAGVVGRVASCVWRGAS